MKLQGADSEINLFLYLCTTQCWRTELEAKFHALLNLGNVFNRVVNFTLEPQPTRQVTRWATETNPYLELNLCSPSHSQTLY
jgi:hypothetical protein